MGSLLTRGGRAAVLAALAGSALALTARADGPLTEADARSFARAVEAAVARGDVAAFSALIDWDAVVDAATKGVDDPAQFRDGFRKGVMGSIQGPTGICGHIIATARQGGSYRFLRSRTRDKHRTALFRLALPGGAGVNYHEYQLERRAAGDDAAGAARATDLYVFFSGEPISRTLRRPYVQAVAEQSRGLLSRLLGAEQDLIKNAGRVKEMNEHALAGRGREALAVYDQLPDSLKKDKNTLLMRLKAAQQVDEATYTRAIARFRELYPDDPCVDIHSIDGYVLARKYDEALAAIDRLDRSVGGDPYLNVLRASTEILAGRLDRAQADARAGVEGVPDMLQAYWTLLAIDLKREDYPAALKTLKLIDRRFPMKFNDLEGLPEYAGFVKSPQFQEWKAYLAARKPAAPAPDREPPADRK